MRDPILEMDTALLLTLDALLKDLNVTHAANRLGITQPALSGRLTRLRQLLGDPLLIPAASGRGMVATPHAEALAPELARLMDRLRRFSSVAQVFDPATSDRTFRIAATDNPAAILAPDLIPAIKAAAPRVRLAFVLPDKARIAADLEAGSADLFIGAAEDVAGGLIGRTLLEETFVTAQRKGHPRGAAPIDLDEFCRLDHLLVSTSGGNFAGMIDDALEALGRTRRVSVSIQSYALAPLVLQASDCVCTLPRRFLARFTTSLDLFEPPVALARFQINAFWHPRMGGDPAHAWLRDQVFQAARAQGRDPGALPA
ncbi:LysR family transcriptional regulator [Methylobrevis albus]|uniref:LysR family transcriptional regulator n=1 Tax=Methylobrevis albus TaxID=2793297 RepID=A0A931MX73_9HYPH|nr:LysR family transcriptional regulator [Methylobrevis albus]MBH0236395.1 LysR family transcriptional regulator [Methylobrevis albus]